MSQAQKRGAENYREGDIVISNAIMSPLKRNEKYVIKETKRDRIKLSHGSKSLWMNPRDLDVTVYSKKSIDIANGDLLEWRKNQDGLTNRQELTVLKVDESKVVLRDTRDQIYRLSTKKPHHLDHGIVKTTYSAQGATKDRVIALVGPNLSKESLYVLASRARNSVEIITDNRSKLIKNAFRSAQKENALEHIDFEPTKLSFEPTKLSFEPTKLSFEPIGL